MHQAGKNCGRVGDGVCASQKEHQLCSRSTSGWCDVIIWNIPRVLFCSLFSLQLLSCCTRRKHAYLRWFARSPSRDFLISAALMMRNAALIVIKSNSPLALGKRERWRQTRFIFHPCRPRAYLKIKSARELSLFVSERGRTSPTFSWLRAHNTTVMWPQD